MVRQVRRRFDPAAALGLLSQGLSVSETAREMGCSRQRAYSLIREARALDLFRRPSPGNVFVTLPPGPLTPTTRCLHDTFPIEAGSPEVCLICHKSGFDWRQEFANPGRPPDLKRYAPKRDLAGGVVVAEKPKPRPTTRRERRAAKFAKREAMRARATIGRLQAAS